VAPVEISGSSAPDQAEQPTDRISRSRRTDFDAYPELEPIRLWGVNAAIYGFGIKDETDLVDQLDEVVITALVLAYAPIASIARETRRVTDRARAAQLIESARMAGMLAMRVADVAAALQASGESAATKVAQAATEAADLVAASVVPGGEAAAVSAAGKVATAVRDAAAAKAAELAHAATVVAQAAARAAVEANHTADIKDVAVRLEVFEAAAAVQAIAMNACYQVAVNAAAIAAEKHFAGKPRPVDPAVGVLRARRKKFVAGI
jgi:hypothetical protein